ncbi:MAG: hypothetical protein WC783_03945 [Candidatus Paceibacterota bacterium]|jgi:hypothetical protein
MGYYDQNPKELERLVKQDRKRLEREDQKVLKKEEQQNREFDVRYERELKRRRQTTKWAQLESILYKLGGKRIVLMPEPKREIDNLVSRGKIFKLHIRRMNGAQSQCHTNTAKLWYKYDGFIICTGYVLNDDGLWRQHSWGIYRKKLIETTDERDIYFGYEMNDNEAADFYEENV